MLNKIIDKYDEVIMEGGILLIAILLMGTLTMCCIGAIGIYGVEAIFMTVIIGLMSIFVIGICGYRFVMVIKEVRSK